MREFKDIAGCQHQADMLVEFVNCGNKSQYFLNGELCKEGAVSLLDVSEHVLEFASGFNSDMVCVLKTYDLESIADELSLDMQDSVDLSDEKIVSSLNKVVKEIKIDWTNLKVSLNKFIDFTNEENFLNSVRKES